MFLDIFKRPMLDGFQHHVNTKSQTILRNREELKEKVGF
jgi:hypothetical protein